MSNSLKCLTDQLIVSPHSKRQQLHLNHPNAKILKDRDIILAAICELKDRCEIARKDPDIHVLLFTIEGSATVYLSDSGKKGIPLGAGQVAILPAGHQHRYVMDGTQWRAIWFYLADTPAWHQISESKPHIRASLTYRQLWSALEGFLAESLRNEEHARLAISHYAELIVLNLDRELDLSESPPQREIKQRLYLLWDEVNANLANNWTVADMAEQVGVSPQHFYKVCARFSGCKPMEMVTQLRMQQAQEFLISTDYMIKSIARLLGYSDSFGFSAAFKRETGFSPKQFREQHHLHYKKQEDGWY